MNIPTQTGISSREIVISRVFDAPRDVVFKAWTSPEHLDRWFGPDGFTNETLEMDFREGGAWRFIMHGPDGVDYPNRMDYTKVVPPECIAYNHTDDQPEPAASFHAETTFSEVGGKTHVTMRALFATVEERDMQVAENGAIEGGKQTLARLAAYVESIK